MNARGEMLRVGKAVEPTRIEQKTETLNLEP